MSFFRRKMVGVVDTAIIDRLPAQGNLVAFWDAADADSWSGSGTWQNLVASPADGAAQSAYDLQLGSTSGSDANDPTFSGTPGGLSSSEYWSLSATTGFELPANTTFTNTLQRTNVACTFGWIVDFGTSGARTLASSLTGGGAGNRGVYFEANFGQVINSGTSTSQSWSPGTGFKRFTWSVDADVNPILEYSIDGTLTTPSITPGSADTSSTADRTLMICANNGYSTGIASGKLYAVVLWNKRLSSAEVTSFNAAFSGRFGY